MIHSTHTPSGLGTVHPHGDDGNHHDVCGGDRSDVLVGERQLVPAEGHHAGDALAHIEDLLVEAQELLDVDSHVSIVVFHRGHVEHLQHLVDTLVLAVLQNKLEFVHALRIQLGLDGNVRPQELDEVEDDGRDERCTRLARHEGVAWIDGEFEGASRCDGLVVHVNWEDGAETSDVDLQIRSPILVPVG